MQQYAERYPIGQRNIKMLDETLEMTGSGAKMSEMFSYVSLHHDPWWSIPY